MPIFTHKYNFNKKSFKNFNGEGNNKKSADGETIPNIELSKANFNDAYLLGYDKEYRDAEFIKKLSLAVLEFSIKEDIKEKVDTAKKQGIEYNEDELINIHSQISTQVLKSEKFWKDAYIDSDKFIDNFKLESKGISLDSIKNVGKSQTMIDLKD
jgi:hypothetical protein